LKTYFHGSLIQQLQGQSFLLKKSTTLALVFYANCLGKNQFVIIFQNGSLHKTNLCYVPVDIIGSLGYYHGLINAIKASPKSCTEGDNIQPYGIEEKNLQLEAI
jgi:hypothetical protein